MNVAAILTFGLMLLRPGVATMAAPAQGALAVAEPPRSPVATFHSSSNLVLVDVVALSAKTGRPDSTLRQDDFQIFDDGRPVPIKTFDQGTEARPLALWFVVQCNMQKFETEGSDLFRGQAGLFKPALKKLDSQDTVAVAHWCDDGQSKLDLLPTSNVESAVTALEQVLTPTFNPDNHDRPGELALENTLQLVVDATRPLVPERLPVVVFLYGDHSGMPRDEADHLIDELLQTSATAYGIKDRRSPGIWFLPGEQKEVAHYIAAETGGEYLAETPETYAAGLEEILQQLHYRYALGFQPETLDGKRHQLRVTLAGAAKEQHKKLRLRYRAAYLPVAGR